MTLGPKLYNSSGLFAVQSGIDGSFHTDGYSDSKSEQCGISAKFSDGTPLKADSSKQIAILQAKIVSEGIIPISHIFTDEESPQTLRFTIPSYIDTDTNVTLNDSVRDDTFELVYDLVSSVEKSINISGIPATLQSITSGNYMYHPAGHNWKYRYNYTVTANHQSTYDVIMANNLDFSDGITILNDITASQLQQPISITKHYMKIIESVHTTFSYTHFFSGNYSASPSDAEYSTGGGNKTVNFDVTPINITSVNDAVGSGGNATVRLIATGNINGTSGTILSQDIPISVNDIITLDTDLLLVDSAQYFTLQILSYSNSIFPIHLEEITAVHG